MTGPDEADTGQSLQEYLLSELALLAAARTPCEVFADIDRHSDGSGHFEFSDVVGIIRAHRDAECA